MYQKISISMEATRIYYEQAAKCLSVSTLYTVFIINPLKIRDYAKSRFDHTKTDKADSKPITNYVHAAKGSFVRFTLETI